MFRKILLLVSIFLFIAGIGLLLYFIISFEKASQLDAYHFLVAGGAPLPACEFTSLNYSKVMTDKESQMLSVTMINPESALSKGECESSLELLTNDFNYSPSNLNGNITIKMPAYEQTTIVFWIITPKNVGTYQIAIRSETGVKDVGISVTNVFGWNAWQIQLYGVILAILGVVGGIGTIFTWLAKGHGWFHKNQKDQQKSDPTKPVTIQSLPTQSVEVISDKKPK